MNDLVNRSVYDQSLSDNALNTDLEVSLPIKLKGGRNARMLKMEASGTYSRLSGDEFQWLQLNYSSDPVPAERSHRYYEKFPDYDLSLNGGATYTQYLDGPRIDLNIGYSFSYDKSKRTSDAYSLTDGDSMYAGEVSLSSVSDMAPDNRCFIPQLSDNSLSVEQNHSLLLSMQSSVLAINDRYVGFVRADGAIDFYKRSFDYFTNNTPEFITRSEIQGFAKALVQFVPRNDKNWKYIVNIGVKSQKIRNMLLLVDHPAKSPLYTYIGNPNLKTPVDNNVYFTAERNMSNQMRHSLRLMSTYTFNAIDHAYSTDYDTGSMTYFAENVKGSYNASVEYEFFTPFGRLNKFNISTKTVCSFRRTYSMTVDEFVNRMAAQESLSVNWFVGSSKLAVNADVICSRFVHSKLKADNFTSWTYKLGPVATVKLPHNWNFATDMTLYARRGFNDPRLNSSDLVWNARVSKSILKGSLIFAADAYDLLHQLNNISYTVNAQSRTEIVSNVIPSYLLFHVMWRFNHQPKKG